MKTNAIVTLNKNSERPIRIWFGRDEKRITVEDARELIGEISWSIAKLESVMACDARDAEVKP